MATLTVDELAPPRPMEAGEVPIIDFAPFLTGDPAAKADVAAQIGEACEQVGFFMLTGHGVTQEAIDEVFAQARRFFDQPQDVRAQSAATWDWYRGWVPPKKVGEDGRKGGLLETYRMMLDLPKDDPDVLAGKPMHAPNRWPENLPGFQEIVGGYEESLLGVAADIQRAFALALDMPENWFTDKFQKPLVQLSLLYYPPLPEGAPLDMMSAYPHTDEGAFTLLTQDKIGGLEVRLKSGEWIAVPLVPGAYVVNVGDMLMKWTNGRFTSTPHRVRNRSRNTRFSIPFFMNPDYDVEIACIDTCCSAENPPRFEPVQNGPHMKTFWEKGMAYLRPDGDESSPGV